MTGAVAAACRGRKRAGDAQPLPAAGGEKRGRGTGPTAPDALGPSGSPLGGGAGGSRPPRATPPSATGAPLPAPPSAPEPVKIDLTVSWTVSDS